MDQQTFDHLFETAVVLHCTGRTPQALIAVDHLLTMVSDCPEMKLACLAERVNLLYHLGQKDEAQRLGKAFIKEHSKLSRTSRQRDKRNSLRHIGNWAARKRPLPF
jgi:hypothetical protein